jgi:hypothetical protein
MFAMCGEQRALVGVDEGQQRWCFEKEKEEIGRGTKKVGDGSQNKEGASRFDLSAAKLTCFARQQSSKGLFGWW